MLKEINLMSSFLKCSIIRGLPFTQFFLVGKVYTPRSVTINIIVIRDVTRFLSPICEEHGI